MKNEYFLPISLSFINSSWIIDQHSIEVLLEIFMMFASLSSKNTNIYLFLGNIHNILFSFIIIFTFPL